MTKRDLLRSLPLALLVAAGLWAQQNPKPTLSTVDQDLKAATKQRTAEAAQAQAAASQAASQAKQAAGQASADAHAAKDERAHTSAAQAATLNKVLLQQAQSEISSLKGSKDTKDSLALAQYKQDQRMLAIETALTADASDKAQALAESKRQHEEMMNRVSEVIVGLVITALCWAGKGIYSLMMDGRRAHAEEARGKAQLETNKRQEGKLDQIHTLVNSHLTAAMENELDARETTLVSLQEVLRLREVAGAPVDNSPVAALVIATQQTKIAELKAQLKDRLMATTIATADLEKHQKES